VDHSELAKKNNWNGMCNIKMPCMVKHTFKLYDSLEQNWSWKEITVTLPDKKYKFLLSSVIISTETWSNG
jgi:hypothetical protein